MIDIHKEIHVPQAIHIWAKVIDRSIAFRSAILNEVAFEFWHWSLLTVSYKVNIVD